MIYTNVPDYLADFRARHSLAEIVDWLDRISVLRPCVVGEAILDRYVFCKTLGVSSKDPTLAVLYERSEMYAGGSLAVANHLAGLCDEVRLVTRLGEFERYEDFITAALRPNVLPGFLTQAGAPTIMKTRFVDAYTAAKLFEKYRMVDENSESLICLKDALQDALSKSDLVLAADFGHGLLSEKIVSRLWASGVWLSVNAQSNSGNRGYNPISKWRRADYCCLANHEIDLETRQRNGDDRDKLLEVTKRIACPRWTVTRGRDGSLHYDVLEGAFYDAPALAKTVVDRVGAGDAVFAVTSLLVKLGAPWEIVAFVGNVAGACLVENLGNKCTLDRAMLDEHIRGLLKG